MNSLLSVTDAERDAREEAQLIELGKAARDASEAITEALYNETRLEVYATCDGIFVGHGTEYGMAGEVHGFDLHEALVALAEALGGES